MNNKLLFKVFAIIPLIFLMSNAKAQMDSVVSVCEAYMPSPYVSDGQQYMALIAEDEAAEFDILFYGGSTYRIVACSNSENSLQFTMYDKKRNVLFSSAEFKNTPYWDFQFEHTTECYIEAKLTEGQKSGFAILLIGFKNNN